MHVRLCPPAHALEDEEGGDEEDDFMSEISNADSLKRDAPSVSQTVASPLSFSLNRRFKRVAIASVG